MKITMTMLTALNACYPARRLVEPMLPLDFNTDPEKNIDLAIRLLDQYRDTPSCSLTGCTQARCRRSLLEDLHWLALQIDRERLAPDVHELAYRTATWPGVDHSLMIAAQSMAIIADTPSKPSKRKR